MPSLPSIASNIPMDLRIYLDRVREILNAQGTNAVLTVGDLTAAGLIQYSNGTIGAIVQQENYGTPPAPTNVSVSGALASIIVTWSLPNYLGHAYTEIWAAPERTGGGVPTIGDAELVGMTAGSVFSHVLGSGATRWYWVRFVNRNNVAGAYNAVEGIQAATGEDPEYLMQVLTEAYGDGSESPYFYLPNAQVINGVLVPAGTYMYDAFIYNGSITNAKIRDAAIDAAKISDASITTAKIAGAAITSALIEDGSITNAKIALAAVGTATIEDGAITNAKIGNAEISLAKIDTASITDLSAIKADMGTITAGKMQSTDGLFVIDLSNKTISIET